MENMNRIPLKKRALALLAATAILAATAFPVSAFAAAPPDVAGKRYEKAVTELAAKNIITGDTDGNFYPESYLTRAQVCTIIVKAMDAPNATVTGTASQNAKTAKFPDLSGYAWANGYIAYAVERGVVTGYPDGTFKPGSDVTTHELLAMALRAAGYTDDKLSGVWPDNYIDKARELNVLTNLPSPLPERATKWMAAQFVYNLFDQIAAANPPASEPGGTDPPAQSPVGSGLIYVSSKFDTDILTFAGKEIAADVKVYAYGVKADYKSDMKLSDKADDYTLQTVYKYKNVNTPAWYALNEKGLVSRIVLPNDVGFSGRAYCVINGFAKMSDGEGNAVDALVTLSAGRTVTWPASASMSVADNIPTAGDCGAGRLFELQMWNGRITNVAATDASFGGKAPNGTMPGEIGSTGGFAEVTDKTGNIVTIGGNAFGIRATAVVYEYDARKNEYAISNLASVRVGSKVRLYDVSDDKDDVADAVILLKE